jgi:hypothetical protein
MQRISASDFFCVLIKTEMRIIKTKTKKKKRVKSLRRHWMRHESSICKPVEPVQFNVGSCGSISPFEMSSGVILQGALLVEALAAVAPKRTRTSVSEHVSVEF